MRKSINERVSREFKKILKWPTLENWRKSLLIVCVVALGIDPLFLFVPLIDPKNFCFTFDKKLGVSVAILRTCIDAFYFIHVIYHLITEVIAPRRAEAYWKGEIVVHSNASIKKRNIIFYLTSDIFSILPIPQVAIFTIHESDALVSKVILKWIILSQYIPRIIRIYPLYQEVTRASGTVTETKWIEAAFNLFLYMLHSYVFGAFWYVSSVEKMNKCWRQVCALIDPHEGRCDLYCRRGVDNSRFLNTKCQLIDPDEITHSTDFNFGMYIDALKSGIVDVKPDDFPRKFFYCFWWGLRNISAFGQNLKTSNAVGDVVFAIIICVCGLVLFAVLIGNVQRYLQTPIVRMDDMEEEKRDTEKWISNWKLPGGLKERIRKHEDQKWRKTRGVEEEAFLLSLPKEIRFETKHHLYKDQLKRVPWLKIMNDNWLLKALSQRVKSVIYAADSYIVRKGEPIKEMLIVTKGDLECMSDYYHSIHLKEGDICGDLLFSVLDPNPSLGLPTSNRTIKTLTEVEGFVLLPDDLKFVASDFNHGHINKLKHIYRFYSVDWRSWALRLIQDAWRKYCERKRSKILHKKRDIKKNLRCKKLNLRAALSVSRFMSKPSRNQRENAEDSSSSIHMLPPLPHKPSDPEFANFESYSCI